MAQLQPMAQGKINNSNNYDLSGGYMTFLQACPSGCKTIPAQIQRIISIVYWLSIAPFRKYLIVNKPLFCLIWLFANGAAIPLPAHSMDGPSDGTVTAAVVGFVVEAMQVDDGDDD